MTQPEPQPVQLQEFLPKSFAVPGQPLDDALTAVRASAARYRAWLEALPEELLHTPCAPGKWTAAEHADHVARASTISAACINGMCDGQDPPDLGYGHVYPDGRLITPAPLLPVAGRDRESLLQDIDASTEALVQAARRAEAEGCLDVECVPTSLFPLLNPLEAVQLMTVHPGMHMKSAAAQA